MGDNYECIKRVSPRRRKQESQWKKDFIVFLHRDVSSGLRDDDDEIYNPNSFTQECEQRVIAEQDNGEAAAGVPEHEAEGRHFSRKDDEVAEPAEQRYSMSPCKCAKADLLVVVQVAKLVPQDAANAETQRPNRHRCKPESI